MTWRTHARCSTADPTIFFPGHQDDGRPMAGAKAEAAEKEARAKAYCRVCVVRPLCLSWAMTLDPEDDIQGILAGLTPRERQALRRMLKTGQEVA